MSEVYRGFCSRTDGTHDDDCAQHNEMTPWQHALAPELLAAAERGDQIIVNMPPQSGAPS